MPFFSSSNSRFAWLTLAEMKSIRGGCYAPGAQGGTGCNGANTSVKGGCASGSCGASGSHGEPSVSVNQITQNMFIVDTPVWSKPAKGPSVDITMSFNSQDATNYYQPFGNKWSFNYSTHLTENTAGTVVVFMPDGRQDVYTPTTGGYTSPIGVYNVLVKLSSTSFELRFPEGGKYVFTIPAGTTSTKPLLTRIEDRWGYGLDMGYDANLNLTTITDATGGVTTLSYDNANRIVLAKVADGRFATWRYDAYGNMIEVTDVEGHAFQYTYDGNVNVTMLNTAQGPWQSTYTGFKTSDTGYHTTVTDPLGNVEKFDYNGHWDYSRTDKRGLVTHFDVSSTIQGLGYIDWVRSPNGDLLTTRWLPSVAQPGTVIDAGGRTTTFTYNAQGRPLTTTNAKGQTTTLVYAANGIDVTGIQDALGNTVMTIAYDALHQPTSVTNRLNQTTTYTYTAWGAPLTITDATNHVTTYNGFVA